MKNSCSNKSYNRWMWIELIGFDNELPDFGVPAFLATVGFTPEVISLLLFNPDFIHTHQRLMKDQNLPEDCCSYGAHPANEDRLRQAWTTHQLKGLVRELQRHGIKVYFAVFDIFKSQEWLKDHSELFYVLNTGEVWPILCPWKRFKEGTFYEDFFVQKLGEVMQDYGFDGFHGADGIAHPRLPIYKADFSEDMVDQFLAATNLQLDNKACGTIEKRANWVVTHYRRELIDFYTQRITGFWQKVTTAIHAQNKKVVLNTAWTRDPFEAIYRYGTDYRKLAEVGVDDFIVEAAAVTLETLEESESSSRYVCQFQAAELLNKAYVPQVPMRWLHGIKDTEENWNALRHAPTGLESEIYGMSNLYRWTSEGRLECCEDGLMVCLADGIRQEDWRWLVEKWDLGFSSMPEELMGVTLIWSDYALGKQIDDFIMTRRWSTHRWLHSLIALGAPIYSVARVEDLMNVKGPILILNSHLFSQEEQKKLFTYTSGPIVMIGETIPAILTPEFEIHETGYDSLVCRVYHADLKLEISPAIKNKDFNTTTGTHDPLSWLSDLDYSQITDNFVNHCAQILMQLANRIVIEKCGSGHASNTLREAKTVSVWATKRTGNVVRLLLRNDNYIGVSVTLNFPNRIQSVHWLNPFTAAKIVPEDNRFLVKVPGLGTTVLDVEFQ